MRPLPGVRRQVDERLRGGQQALANQVGPELAGDLGSGRVEALHHLTFNWNFIRADCRPHR